jgi:hypothetical protein
MGRSSELTELIDRTPWVDVHEHIVEERHRLGAGAYEFEEIYGEHTRIPSDWSALVLGGYALDDFVTAGLPPAEAARFQDEDLSPVEKWDLVSPYMDACRMTGYMRAVDATTERLFGERLSRATCEQIDRQFQELRRPGYYETVLRDAANINRCQVNSLEFDPFWETETPHLLDRDLSISGLVRGHHASAESEAGIEIGSLDDYLDVIECMFERHAANAVAVKCFWAYFRPLRVGPAGPPPRSAFARLRRGDGDLAGHRQVEDYLFRRCVELATAAGLPVKLHLGSLARTNDPHLEHVFSCIPDVTRLVQEYPRTTFVLMHMAWPQQEQLLALAKHQPNVVVEMSWTWTVAPLSTREFVLRFLSSVPATKLLCFGADYQTVENVVGHAELARRGLQDALEGLVDVGWAHIDDVVALVPMLMHGNADRVLPSPSIRRSAAPG